MIPDQIHEFMKMNLKQKLYQWIQRLPYRRSSWFWALQNILEYTPFEKNLELAMNFVFYSRLKGDYWEFGVSEGRSFAAAFHFAQMRGLGSMKFYAFDSFQGLPEPRGGDSEFWRFKKGYCACDIHKFKKNITGAGVDPDKIIIVPGWYNQVLNEQTKKQLPANKAAIVHIDCDLYESTISALNFITDYMQDGSIIIFDDWFAFNGNPRRGEQKAFREWLENNRQFQSSPFYRAGWSTRSFIIHIGNG